MSRFTWLFCGVAWLLACHLQVTAANVVWPAAGLAGGETDYTIGSSILEGGAGVEMLIIDAGVGNYILQAQQASIGIAHFWYETSAGAPIDATTVAGAIPFCGGQPWTYGSINVTENQPFYIGFALYSDFSASTSYGWASLTYNGTTLSLLGSAAETTGVGLYAGTYNPIPEPCTTGLALAGLAAIALRRRWRRHLPHGARL